MLSHTQPPALQKKAKRLHSYSSYCSIKQVDTEHYTSEL